MIIYDGAMHFQYTFFIVFYHLRITKLPFFSSRIFLASLLFKDLNYKAQDLIFKMPITIKENTAVKDYLWTKEF